MNNTTLQTKYENARARIRNAESTASDRTMNVLWREFFKIEDACRAAGCL